MTDRPYAVITFLPNDEDTEPTSDVVPMCWLLANNTKAYWPNFAKRGTSDKRSKLILSLAEPDKNWPIYDIKFCHGYDTYNKARKAANIQNDQDRTVGTEISDIDHRRKRKKNSKYATDESSGKECNLNYNVKKRSKSNQLCSHSEDEEMDEDLKAKVAVLLSKTNNRKSRISQDKVSKIITSKKKKLDSKKDCLDRLNNTTESYSCSKETNKTTSTVSQATKAITSMSFPSTSSQFNRCDDVDRLEEQLLSGSVPQQSEPVLPLLSSVKQIVPEKNGQEINAVTDNKYGTISQKLSQPTCISNEQRKIITSIKEVIISPSKRQLSSDPTVAAIKKIKTELLQEISSKLDFVMMNTTKILTYLAPEESLLLRPDNLPALPLNSVDEYDIFEEFLSNGTNFSTVVQYFAGRAITVGNDWQSAIYLVSKLLISNKLARAISWGGTKDTKIALANSKIMEAVYCAVLKNHPKSDLKMVKLKIQRWLYTGNQRKI